MPQTALEWAVLLAFLGTFAIALGHLAFQYLFVERLRVHHRSEWERLGSPSSIPDRRDQANLRSWLSGLSNVTVEDPKLDVLVAWSRNLKIAFLVAFAGVLLLLVLVDSLQ